MRDLVTKQPTGVNFIVSSATTYQSKPPSFDLVYLDPDTMRPVDYEIYALDLDHANAHDEIRWSRYFDYRTGFNMTDLRPQNFFDLAQRVFHEPKVCSIYAKNRFVGGPGYEDSPTCDYISNYCQIIASEEEDKYFCQGQNQNAWSRFMSNNLLDTIANLINGAWYTKKDGTQKGEIDNHDYGF